MLQLLDKAKNFVVEKVVNLKKPAATVNDVDMSSVHRDYVEYFAKISISNPYSHSLPICEVSYTLKSDGRVIASGNMTDPGSLKANGVTMLNVTLKVPHSILMSLARDIGTDWDIDYELEVDLTIDLPIIGNFTIPLSNKGEIKLPTWPF
ncbi:late embryogenesis abundant protein Lea14-A [Manihot esculenta]|uniref:Late-embryogenesis abundant protein n=1 Tax=Manihot esculenta TaxID=3983 RepID=V9M4W4_MANES|nr:late embryogenesis abundant protein Lea14-A [Manihot esculenta]AGC51774.1 late-embryogenesis abundant protein [Manihot esculenta]OAY49090.1 hypothetical protein MANES_05G028700v8 [Manihot esculenta]